jgi:hypothetical protein
MAAQKNIESPRTILILRLTRIERESRSAIFAEHRLPACSSRQLAANRVVLARRWLHRLRKLHLAGSQMLQASSLCSPERNLHGDRRFNGWMGVVTDEFEILELEVMNVFDSRIQFQPR